MEKQSRSNIDGANVLLTGATGLIGGELLRRLLETRVRKIYCIVRGSPQSGMDRLKHRLCGEVCETLLSEKVSVVPGDFAEAGLGLPEHAQRELAEAIDLVFHCAAVTSFLQNKLCWDVNFEGTRRLLNVCRAFDRDVTFFHFGSSSTCGAVSDVVLREEDFPFPGNDYFAHYAASKAEVELELVNEVSEPRIVVLRPSMVLPTGTLPESMLHEVAWSLALMQQCSALPINPDARVDIVPLGFVSDYTLRLAEAELSHGCYHLTAGPDGARDVASMLEIVSSSFEDRPIKLLQGTDWDKHSKTMSRRERVMVRQISPYFPFINQNVVFDNSRTFAAVGAEPDETFDLARHLPEIVGSLSLSESLRQSRYD